jgi:uncharacterized phage infection (PIP) family protein YhgE
MAEATEDVKKTRTEAEEGKQAIDELQKVSAELKGQCETEAKEALKAKSEAEEFKDLAQKAKDSAEDAKGEAEKAKSEAEDAAKEAAPIFINAVKGMSIADGLSILKGNDDAATQYLKQNTQALLLDKFKPIVENSLHKVSATKYWEQLVMAYNRMPMVEKMNPNLSEYATQKAIDGIFIVVAEEELQIRKNPAARVSAILKKVFNR